MPDYTKISAEVFSDLESVRERLTDRLAEGQMSVNDWVDRVRVAAQTAHKSARAGTVSEEYNAWLEVAASAIGRAEQVLAFWQEQP